MYEEGIGIAKNYAEAVKWYHKAAEQGEPQAQANLGLLYFNALSLGLSSDPNSAYTEALHWFSKAANQGNATGQFGLAGIYATGKGVPEDGAEALKWLRRAAAQGDENAQNVLRIKGLSW
ncbi:MAG: tetratricopeptide repeat protein [Gammaproteobacteria bacterium]